MGSGLILLVIVGAWLAVLVPMGLKGRDNATTVRGTERFSDAMRVLSRRPTGNERTSLRPRRAAERAVLSAERTPVQERVPTPSLLDRFDDEVFDDDLERAPLSLAARRRRVLLVLGFLTFMTGTVSLMGLGILRWVSLLLLAATVAFVVHCRRQELLKQEQRRRESRRRRAEGRVAAAPRVAGIPDRMPARPAPLNKPLPAPAARYDEPVAAGSDWQPVPVPLPTYVGKAVAPPRPRRVVDLTKPGEWSAAVEASTEGAGVLADIEDGKDLDVILERRRAVGGW